MQINDELINYLEELSRLRLTEEEREAAKGDLGKILGYIDQLGELDAGDAPALSHPFPAVNCFREDVAASSAPRDAILRNAPEQKDGCFKVPKTVE